MKTLRFVLSLMLIIAFTAIAALGVDVVPAATVPPLSIMEWFTVNSALVFGVAWAISELLAVIPAFKGNGFLDIILNFLRKRTAPKPTQVQ